MGSDSSRSRAESESLAIPRWVREEVDERDGTHCRVCGRHLGEARAHHHIWFGGSRQGMGGRRDHDPTGIVTVCWMYGPGKGIPPCHDLVHSNKGLYQPLLAQVIASPGITVMQLQRWQRRTSQQT